MWRRLHGLAWAVKSSMRLGGVIAALAVAVASDACFEYACTLVACSDGLTVTLQSTDGSWKPGIYTFDLTINHTTARCTITVNLAPPEVNPGGQGQCPSGITLTMSQESTCVSHTKTNPDGTTEFGSECAPIPGHFTQTLEISGTPLNGAYAPVIVTASPIVGV